MIKSKKDINYFINIYLSRHPLFFSFIRPQEAYLFHKYMKYLKSPTLDFGSGDGFFADVVFGPQQIDTGIDLETNRTLEGKDAKAYKEIVYYDGITLPFQDNTYKTIVSNCVLEHIPDIQTSLKEIHRVLKPGGYFMTTVMADKWENYQLGATVLGEAYRKFMRTRQAHYNLFSDKKWRRTFTDIGFKITKEIGYISEKNARYLDLAHYLSIPSLITRNIAGKWVPFPQLGKKLNIDTWVEKYISVPVPASQSAALFYILRK